MSTPDVSKFAKSALIIDDEWSEVQKLHTTLNKGLIPTVFCNPLEEEKQNGTQKENPPFTILSPADDSFKTFDIIFLDLNYKQEEINTVPEWCSNAIGFLEDKINENTTPYGIILWSTESTIPFEHRGVTYSALEYVKKFFYSDAFDIKPKPLFIIDIDKSKITEMESADEIINALDTKLKDSKIAYFFSCAKNNIDLSISSIYNKLIGSAQELIKPSPEDKAEILPTDVEESFFSLLKHITYSNFGFDEFNDESLEPLLCKKSLDFLSQSIHEENQYINNNLTTSGVFTSCANTIKPDLYPDLKKGGKPAIELKRDKRNKIGETISKLNFNITFSHEDEASKDHPGTILRNEHYIYINITPPCDVANPKDPYTRYLEGRYIEFKTFGDAIEYYKKNHPLRLYLTAPCTTEDTCFICCFNLTRIISAQPENLTPFMSLKESIFADLLYKFGAYNSRPGARSLYA